jgi:putative transposase
LLLGEPGSGTLADAIHGLKLSSTKQGQYASEQIGSGHFWQKRYYDRNIRSYSDFTEKLRYIHRNPVKRELCEKPEDWPWSSFRHYALGEIGMVEIESEWTARRRTDKEPETPQPGAC